MTPGKAGGHLIYEAGRNSGIIQFARRLSVVCGFSEEEAG